ncbi:MAG: DNA polymerase III subunit delta [Blastocatellia bacterium]|nr:DNA polymerase III subunit delta [Blastocatellia bacterium]MCS7158250.1 DNA polymerase III subunit delta [Blastocatellia bacterium]MCX7753088.1 DNA polymerase III subunit delta [Blastocatellia bacterium]MDW8169403.1 DNA polymerase III subunit delta [Acidobacteriota bacterium]MDW8256471.1 DNA polymerase III subunit delta [Acidobacteriota bacterium]
MKRLTPETFRKAIERGEIEPLYLFTGWLPEGMRRTGEEELYAPEAYLLREAVQMLIARALDPTSRAFNLSQFSALETPMAKILATARELPAFSSRRVVIVRDLEKKWRAREDAEEARDLPAEQTALIEYLKHPAPTTTLVFVLEHVDRRLTIVTALLKACTIVEFRRLSEREALEWVKGYVRRQQAVIEEAAAAALVGLVGSDLTLLAAELDKLLTFVSERRMITRSDVELLVVRHREHSNFELTDWILARRPAAAWRILRRQLAAGEEPVKLLGAIASLYRRMLLAKELMARGAPSAEVARAAGLPPSAAGKFNEQVRRIPREEILAGLRHIARTDEALKTSVGPPEVQLELLLYRLCVPSEEEEPV